MSHHFAVLNEAEWIGSRRVGKEVFYTLDITDVQNSSARSVAVSMSAFESRGTWRANESRTRRTGSPRGSCVAGDS